MVTQQIEVDWRELRAALRNCQRNLRGYVREELRRVAEYVLRTAISRAPVETGRLRDSMRVDMDYGASVEAGISFVASAPYAVYMEEGFTKRNGDWWEGKHFLRSTMEELEYLFEDAVMEGMTRAVIAYG